MDKSQRILTRILECKGQYVSLTIRTEVPAAAAHKHHKLEKTTSSLFRAGIQFKNLKSVKDAIEAKERDEIQPLRWGKWKQYPYIIEHKGQDYIRLYPAVNTNTQAEITYKVDGNEVTKETFQSYLKPSSTTYKDIECFTINADNIIDIKD